jgi:GNAT superfamily N-acetyltransferase
MLTVDEPVVIHEDGADGIRILARPDFSDAFVAHLEAMRFGTSGLCYRRLGVRQQLERLPASVFLELYKGSSMAGTYVISQAPLEASAGAPHGVYRGLLTVHPDARGAGLGRRLIRQTFDWIEARARQTDRPVVSWGCIERDNLRSLRALESMGARRIGVLESLTAYRQWPRETLKIEQLDGRWAEAIEAGLSITYGDCGLRLPATGNGTYMALALGDTVIAGARVSLTRVDMATTGGAWDFLHRYLLRHVPAARRRFDPHNFTYLRLSDVIIREGKERLWKDLLGTLMAMHGVHMAMFMVDPRSRASELLKNAGIFGRLTASTRQEVAVLANAWNAPEGTLHEARSRPLGIGPLDI